MSKTKRLTPLKSIRKFCLWCCDNQYTEVEQCTVTDCEFHSFRFGKKIIKGSLIKVIRNKCLDCGEGTSQAVKKCVFNDCPLYPYRNGRSPAHQKNWLNGLAANTLNKFSNKTVSTPVKNSKE